MKRNNIIIVALLSISFALNASGMMNHNENGPYPTTHNGPYPTLENTHFSPSQFPILYNILGVNRNATTKEIIDGYNKQLEIRKKEAARSNRVPMMGQNDDLGYALRTLTNKESREAYDTELRSQGL